MPGTNNEIPTGQRILVVYFSHSGNTRQVAQQISQLTGGGLHEIVPVDPYPTEYNAVVAQAKEELHSGYQPALKSSIGDIDAYDVVFLGYPNWWGTVPRPVVTLLAGNNFQGKIIAPFCTHEGSGLGRSVADIKQLCPNATVTQGLTVRGTKVSSTRSEVEAWLASVSMNSHP